MLASVLAKRSKGWNCHSLSGGYPFSEILMITNELAGQSAFFLIPPSTYLEPTKRAPNGQLHLRLRLRAFRGSRTHRRSRQVEAMLGGVCLTNFYINTNFIYGLEWHAQKVRTLGQFPAFQPR